LIGRNARSNGRTPARCSRSGRAPACLRRGRPADHLLDDPRDLRVPETIGGGNCEHHEVCGARREELRLVQTDRKQRDLAVAHPEGGVAITHQAASGVEDRAERLRLAMIAVVVGDQRVALGRRRLERTLPGSEGSTVASTKSVVSPTTSRMPAQPERWMRESGRALPEWRRRQVARSNVVPGTARAACVGASLSP
jgi:hypothetical protein